jgi:hypothetical protein
VDRFSLSSPAVHQVSANNVYPADMGADSAGLYYEGIAGSGDYVFRAGGNVYLLAIHENQNGSTYLDAFRGLTLGTLFSTRVSDSDTDIAGTGLGLLLLGAQKVSLLDTGNGPAVVTVSHSTTYLLRLAG